MAIGFQYGVFGSKGTPDTMGSGYTTPTTKPSLPNQAQTFLKEVESAGKQAGEAAISVPAGALEGLADTVKDVLDTTSQGIQKIPENLGKGIGSGAESAGTGIGKGLTNIAPGLLILMVIVGVGYLLIGIGKKVGS